MQPLLDDDLVTGGEIVQARAMLPFHHSTAFWRSKSDSAWSTLCGSSTTT